MNARLTNSRYPYFACAIALLMLLPDVSPANDLPAEIDAFVQDTCIACHDEHTETRLDLTSLKGDFDDEKAFRKWVHVFDRVKRGEMPPAEGATPDANAQRVFLSQLESELTRTNRQWQQTAGRVPSRRLSRLEYEHTLHDLLGIGGDIARYLPPANKSGAFDVVTAKQDMSSVHVKGFLSRCQLRIAEVMRISLASAPLEFGKANSLACRSRNCIRPLQRYTLHRRCHRTAD